MDKQKGSLIGTGFRYHANNFYSHFSFSIFLLLLSFLLEALLKSDNHYNINEKKNQFLTIAKIHRQNM